MQTKYHKANQAKAVLDGWGHNTNNSTTVLITYAEKR